MRGFAHARRAGGACIDGGMVWQPPIGDRVRIRPDLDGRCPDGAHDWHERGHTGTVVHVRGGCGDASHPYLVVFDEPHPVMHLAERAVESPARHYAAEELEPIAAPGVRLLPEIVARA